MGPSHFRAATDKVVPVGDASPDVVVRDLCASCKNFREIAYIEKDTNRCFCSDCAQALPPTAEELALLFIAATTPFKVGDVVECRTAGEIYDGIGVVEEISTDLEHGATAVYPTFLVRLTEKAYPNLRDAMWYCEICLTHVKADKADHE